MADDQRKIVTVVESWRHRLQCGIRAFRAGDTRVAEQSFADAYALAPEQPEVLLALGRHHMRQRRFSEARSLLEAAVAADPASTAAVASLARLLGLHLDRRQHAFKLLHRALGQYPSELALHVVRGELLLEEGAFSEARAAFAQALDLDTTDEAARMGLAQTYNAEGIALGGAGQADRAVFAFKRAIDLTPDWSAPCVNLGVALGRLGRPERAVAAYERALRSDPYNPVAHFNMATTYHELGRLSEAVQAIERLQAICGDYPRARVALADILVDLGEFDRAIALLLEEMEADGNTVEVWSSLGLAYICSGNVDHGETCLQKAVALDPGHFNAYFNLAVLYATQRRHEEAQSVLKRAFELDPQRTSRAVESQTSLTRLRELSMLPFLQ